MPDISVGRCDKAARDRGFRRPEVKAVPITACTNRFDGFSPVRVWNTRIVAAYVRSHTDTATRNPQHRDTGAAIGASLAAAASAGTHGEKVRRAPFTDASADAELSTDSLIEEMQHSAEEPQ